MWLRCDGMNVLLDGELAREVISLSLRGAVSFSELYVERRWNRRLRVADGEVRDSISGIQCGAGLRLFHNDQVVYGYTNEIAPAALSDLARRLRSVAVGTNMGRPNSRGRGGVDFCVPGVVQPLNPRPTFARSQQERLRRLLDAERRARTNASVKHVESTVDESVQDVVIFNSEGVWAEDRRVRALLVVDVVAVDGASVETGRAHGGVGGSVEIFERFSPDELAERAVEGATAKLGARPAPSGRMPVVVASGFGGVLFHEALGHLVEATAVAKEASILSGRMGDMIASPLVTYVDAGARADGWGSARCDDEGTPTTTTTLIDRGVLVGYLIDLWNARQMGSRSTGSGRREDYTFAPTARMHTTFVTAGSMTSRQLLESVGHGLYVRSVTGGEVKPGTGEFSFGVDGAYMIRSGQIAEPVRGALLIGSALDAIGRVGMVAEDLTTAAGMCGSTSGSIPVEVGQPHILVSDLVVGSVSR